MPNATNRFKKFEELLGRLPNENRETLKMLLRHLNRVASHSSQNRMQQHNLAIVLGPTLFHNGDGAVNSAAKNKKAAKKTKPSKKVRIYRYLIEVQATTIAIIKIVYLKIWSKICP